MDTLRITLISPSVTETELGSDITDKDSAEFLKQVRKTALTPNAIAHAVLYAISQPADVGG